MKISTAYDLISRRWTLRSIVATVPIAGALTVLLVVLVGVKLAEQRLDHIEQQVKRSQAYQYNAMQMPIVMERIHAGLYKRVALQELGQDASEIEETQQALLRDYQKIETLREKLDPRVRKLDLDRRMQTLQAFIDNAYGPMSPQELATVIEGYQDQFRSTESLFEAIAAQSRILVYKDLDTIAEGTIDQIWMFFYALAAAGVLLCAAALAAGRFIARPILRLAHTVEAFDKGNLNIVVPATDRVDEIGKVAKAIELFKDSMQQNKVLQSERDDLTRNLERKVTERTSELAIERERLRHAQQKAEEQRQEMTAQLRSEFGQVLNAASAGDFTQRVAAAFADENLQSLANDINHFVERVDTSVAAVSKKMHQMAQGELDLDENQEFSGDFADIMAQIQETAAQITEQSGQLNHIALHDTLTELPNRRFLEDRLAAYTKLLSITELPLAVLHIDLDRFKEINDTLGHAAGDLVLKRSAEVLSKLAENDDFVARVGGDEFIMLCPMLDTDPDGEEPKRIQKLGESIVADLSEPVEIDGQEAKFGASVGIAFSTPETTDLSNLIVDADIALYQSKEAGRNQAQVYSSNIASALSQKRILRDDLTTALDCDQFVPFFQPKYDAATHVLIGVEALVRWEHPTRGLLTPDQFLPAATETKIVQNIDQVVLCKAADALNKLWQDHNIEIPELSVNVCQERLHDPTLLTSLDQITAPFQISFELLESIVFDEQDDRFYWILDQLRERDIGIQIDDFGSGHASISAMLNIGPERIKIDRSLVMPITEKNNNKQLIKGLVDIAASMDINVTAEGVETMQHANILLELGCDVLQGFAFAKPMSVEALVDLHQDQHRNRASKSA